MNTMLDNDYHSPKRKRNGIQQSHSLDKTVDKIVDTSLSGFTSGDASADYSFSLEQLSTVEEGDEDIKSPFNNKDPKFCSSLSGITDRSMLSPPAYDHRDHREYQRTHTLFESLSVHGNCGADDIPPSSHADRNRNHYNKGEKSPVRHQESPVPAEGSPAVYEDLDMELDVDEDEDKYYDNKNQHLRLHSSSSHLGRIPFILNDENSNPNPSSDFQHLDSGYDISDDGRRSGYSSPNDMSHNGVFLYQDDTCSPTFCLASGGAESPVRGLLPTSSHLNQVMNDAAHYDYTHAHKKHPGRQLASPVPYDNGRCNYMGRCSSEDEGVPSSVPVTDDDREYEEDDCEVSLFDMMNSRPHNSSRGSHHRKLSVGDDDLEGIRSPLLKSRRPNSTTNKAKEGKEGKSQFYSPSPPPRRNRSPMPSPQNFNCSAPVGLFEDNHNSSTTSDSYVNDKTLVPSYAGNKTLSTSVLTTSSSNTSLLRPYTKKAPRPVPDQSVFDTSFGSSHYSGYISSSTDDLHTQHASLNNTNSLNNTVNSPPIMSNSTSFSASLSSRQQPTPLRAPPPTPANNHYPSAHQSLTNNNNASIMEMVDNLERSEGIFQWDTASGGEGRQLHVKENLISSTNNTANNTSEEGDLSSHLRHRPLPNSFKNSGSPSDGLFGHHSHNRSNSLFTNRVLVTMKRSESQNHINYESNVCNDGFMAPSERQLKSPTMLQSSDESDSVVGVRTLPVPYPGNPSRVMSPSPKPRYRRSSSICSSGSTEKPSTPGIDAISFHRDFINEGVLGSGTFADVYCVQEVSGDHNRFAVKKSKKQFRSKKDRNWLLNEVHTMKRLCEVPCEYIIRLVCAWQEGGYFYVQTELSNKGTLSAFTDKFIAGNQSILDSTVFHVVHDLLSGLKHIHECNIVHMDIKPANLLISESGRIKIGDFGLACDCNRDEDGREGDIRYMAPELLQFSINIQPSVDVFSLGMTIYEMCAAPIIKELPTEGEIWRAFREDRMPQLPRMVTDKAEVGSPSVLAPLAPPLVPNRFRCNSFIGSENAVDVNAHEMTDPVAVSAAACSAGVQRNESIIKSIQSCLHSDPTLRPTCAELLSSWTELWEYFPYLNPANKKLTTPTASAKTTSNVNTAPHHHYHTRQQLRQQQGLDVTVSYNEEAPELDRCRSPTPLPSTPLFVDSSISAVPLYQPNRPVFRRASFVPVTTGESNSWLTQNGGSDVPPISAARGLSINIEAAGVDCTRMSAVVTPVGDSCGGGPGSSFWQSWNPLGRS